MVDAEYYKKRKEQLIEEYKNSELIEYDADKIIGFLKKQGCSVPETIILLNEIKNMRIGEAKIRVLYSSHWSSVEKSKEELQEALDRYDEYYKQID